MEEVSQFTPNRRVGDWFFLKEHTIIRDYGFVHELYILLSFLTPIIFSLEFIKIRVHQDDADCRKWTFHKFQKGFCNQVSFKSGPIHH